jgi:hypothetical protein
MEHSLFQQVPLRFTSYLLGAVVVAVTVAGLPVGAVVVVPLESGQDYFKQVLSQATLLNVIQEQAELDLERLTELMVATHILQSMAEPLS